jgi:hypothetical protein
VRSFSGRKGCNTVWEARTVPRPSAAVLLFVLSAVTASAAPAQAILEKEFPFPPTVQWVAGGNIEVSLIGVAWGLANSPAMIAKGPEKPLYVREKPKYFPDRPYALALKFRAEKPGLVSTEIGACSGLVRISDINGEQEVPWELTPSGFIPLSGAPCGADLFFHQQNTIEFWDFFPVSVAQTEFLFQAFPGGFQRRDPVAAFRIILQQNDVVVVNASRVQKQCPDFTRDFSGTVGSGSQVNVQITLKGTTLSGTEQYARVGTTLWLTGRVDSLGNFVLNESYPKDHLTGIFKGKLSQGCRTMAGYFSKPDGSRLQPFEFHEPNRAP